MRGSALGVAELGAEGELAETTSRQYLSIDQWAVSMYTNWTKCEVEDLPRRIDNAVSEIFGG